MSFSSPTSTVKPFDCESEQRSHEFRRQIFWTPKVGAAPGGCQRLSIIFDITRDSNVGTSAPFAKTRVASTGSFGERSWSNASLTFGCRFRDSDENAVRMILPTGGKNSVKLLTKTQALLTTAKH